MRFWHRKKEDMTIKYSGRRCAVCGAEEGYLYHCEKCGEILCKKHKNKNSHECDPNKIKKKMEEERERRMKERKERRERQDEFVAESVPGFPGVIKYRKKRIYEK